eukprot:TRINITY_DN51720_c0_g1_i1.p2 TRINITY_DN51720_c0_g1~~TRINITY_DN51720_c0_g1_i1.p2  ORF type:complete len:309 (+),score=89.68 TRINITY_DN51720_c0_g1_i1:86-928(+)
MGQGGSGGDKEGGGRRESVVSDSGAAGAAAPTKGTHAAAPAPPPVNAVATAGDVRMGDADGAIPTIIRWPHPGEVVQLRIDGQGEPVPMKRAESFWACVVNLRPGQHQFHFVVDGQNIIDKYQPITQQGDRNVISVQSRSVLREDSGEDAPDRAQPERGAAQPAQSDYCTTRHKFEESRKFPPLFPPHLRFTPLNQAPQFNRPPQEALAAQQSLPQPYHVTINHAYFQAREGYNVVGTTHRHQDKFTTVVYYRAQQRQPEPSFPESADDGGGEVMGQMDP